MVKLDRVDGGMMESTPRISRLMVAVDTSTNSTRAGELAVQLAERVGAELVVLHAVPMPSYTFAEAEVGAAASSIFQEYYAAAQKEGKSTLDRIVGLAEAKGVKASGIMLGPAVSVVETIVDYAAKNKVDLIVVGTRGHTGFRKLLMGSVSSGIVNHAHCSVLVVR